MKKLFSVILMITLVAAVLTGCGKSVEEKDEVTEVPATEAPAAEPVEVRVGALKGPTAMGMVKLMQDSEEQNTEGNAYTFDIYAAPDEIVPLLVKGDLDIAAVPANLASVLYNNTNGNVQVLAINTLGVLYIVENGDSVQTIEDLKGKTIYASGKGATPEYALNYCLKVNGLDPDKDVTIEYKSEHSECLSAILNDPQAIAMLPQPFVTSAQMKNDAIRIAIDLNDAWDTENEESALLTGVVVARKDFVDNHPEAVELFLSQYKASVDYVNSEIEDAAQLVGAYDIIDAAVAQKALPYCNIVCITGEEMKAKLGSYLAILYDQDPSAVGGKIPEEIFYYPEN